jgi:hypothetical protein
MKNILIKNFTILGCIILISGCMKQMSESSADTNAGFNGSFEHIKDGLPANWLVYTQNTTGEGNFTIMPDTSDYMEGKQSLKFSVQNCSHKGGRFSPGIAQEMTVKEGEEYKIFFYIKNEGADLRITIAGVNAFNRSEGIVLHSSETIYEWRKFEYKYKIPSSMDRLRFEVSILKPGTMQIDGIEIGKLEKT